MLIALGIEKVNFASFLLCTILRKGKLGCHQVSSGTLCKLGCASVISK